MNTSILFNPKQEIKQYLKGNYNCQDFWESLEKKESIFNLLKTLPDHSAETLYLILRSRESHLKVFLKTINESSSTILNYHHQQKSNPLITAFLTHMQTYSEADFIDTQIRFKPCVLSPEILTKSQTTTKNIIDGLYRISELSQHEAISLFSSVWLCKCPKIQQSFLVSVSKVAAWILSNHNLNSKKIHDDETLYLLRLFSNLGNCFIHPIST